jgi:TolA-binding protein
MKLSFTFFILVFLFAGCSKISDNEYMDKADASLKQNDITGAVESYESLVEEYPESKIAPEALEKLAAIYQNNMTKNLSQEESLKKASSLYRKLYDKYPKSDQAAKALFMSGYILANEPLKEYDEATKTYTLFLEKFPNNEWADDAKVEIKNMGKPPGEILGKETVTGK